MIPYFDQFSVLCTALRHPRVGRDQIVAFQNQQLRRLVTHTYNNVPYYHRLFDQHGITPQDIRTVADLFAIPITSRTDVQQLMRHQISTAFRAPVFNTYGSHEFKLLAWEYAETGEFHTCDDGMILEVLKEGRPAASGERGEVVGTNLHSFAMPFIRYRLGDIVMKGSDACRCGQPFSTIQKIPGRMIDYFPLLDGRLVHPYEIVVPYLLGEDVWIRQYQLTQERQDRVILRVVPSTTPSPQKLAFLEESVTTLLDQGVEFHVILVPEIQLELNGKFRVSRSLVKSHYDGIDWDQRAIGEHR